MTEKYFNDILIIRRAVANYKFIVCGCSFLADKEVFDMGKINWKEWGTDILVDLFAGMIIAIGIYNFALNANFPVAGFSGIAIIMYHLIGLPVGAGTILLNVPVAIFCYKFLGRRFFIKSVKSMVISSLLMDYTGSSGAI